MEELNEIEIRKTISAVLDRRKEFLKVVVRHIMVNTNENAFLLSAAKRELGITKAILLKLNFPVSKLDSFDFSSLTELTWQITSSELKEEIKKQIKGL